jgi:DNA-directed RNA polymerase subunit RPC12/RpoP
MAEPGFESLENAPPPLENERFPCAQCGAQLRFRPGAAALVCDHCGFENQIAGEDPGPWGGETIRELDYEAAIADRLGAEEQEETRTAHCEACGADVEFDPAVHAAECPFCAAPLVVDTGANRHIKPKGVAPFQLSEGAARDAMRRWLGALWFAPSELKEYARAGRPMQGVYVPYWTFDADTQTQYSGMRGDVYYVTQYVTVVQNGKSKRVPRQVPKIRWTPRSGRVRRWFDDVLVLASRALPKIYTDRLAPWDLAALEPYRPDYLAGFRAEAYTVQLDEGFAEARQIMNRVIERDVRFDIGGDRQQIHQMRTKLDAITFKHILLPVWMAAYKYRGETYRFVVNGQTGAVQGERPYSRWKIAFAVLIGLIAAAAVGYLVATNQ